MGIKLLTFIGTGNYHPVKYSFKGKVSSELRLFPIAVCEFFDIERISVFLTEEAKKAKPKDGGKLYIEEFREFCENQKIYLEEIDIPQGSTQEELWEIFDIITEAVDEEERIIIDVTHALRSIPIFAVVVANYLRKIKKVEVEGILYGAYEVRDENTKIAPIFDLSPVCELMDWLFGIDAFLNFSHADFLAEILRTTHQKLWRSGIDKPKILSSIGKNLKNFSQAIWFNNPFEAMKQAQSILKLFEEEKSQEVFSELEKWGKPFYRILEKLKEKISKLAHSEPEKLTLETLQKQKEIITYYKESHLYFQALTLAREWLVNWVIYLSPKEEHKENWLKREFREKVERWLSGLSQEKIGITSTEEIPEWVRELHQAYKIGGIFHQTGEKRNLLAHCWMREKNTPSFNKLTKKIDEILNKIFALPLE